MRIDILTLFPEMFDSVLGASILKRAAQAPGERTGNSPADTAHGRAPVSFHLHNIRDHSEDKHRKVDKAPYGGGPGMVIQCQPIWDCVQAVEQQANAQMSSTDAETRTLRIFMTPQGKTLNQPRVEQLAAYDRLLIIAGHYEGVDQRVIDALAPIEEISVGDYVLSGGELAAMVLVDAVVRLIPGVLGDAESTHHESFSAGADGLLDYPHYTRPESWRDQRVPEVLLSGNHAAIEKWRRQQARQRTQQRRADLLKPDDQTSS